MNERIKDLLPVPWTFPFPDRELYTKEQMVHLAETIVRECSRFTNEQLAFDTVDGQMIREHFGLE